MMAEFGDDGFNFEDMSGWMNQSNPFGGYAPPSFGGDIYSPGEPGYDTGGSSPFGGGGSSGGFGMGDRGLGSTDDGTAGGYTGGPSGVNMGLDWSKIAQQNPGALASLAKMFGFQRKDGSLDLSSLIAMLGTGVGGYLGYKATNEANDQVQQGIQNSNKIIQGTLGGNAALYQPYRDAGLQALTKMQNMPQSNLAGQFGGGLAGQFGPIAGQFQSLGSGKGMTLGQLSKGR